MAPYAYQTFVNPYVGSIEEMLARSGDPYASAAQSIGQAVSAIPGQMQLQKRMAVQDDINAAQLAAAKRAAGDVAALDRAGEAAPTDRTSFLSSLPGHLRPEIEKKYAEVDKLALDAKAAKQKAAEAEADYFGGLAAGIKPYLAGEDGGRNAVQLALQHAKEQGYDTSAIERQIAANPSVLPTLLDGLIQSSPTQRKLLGEEADRTLRQTQEARALKTAEQTAADREADNRRQDAAQRETERHNRSSEAQAAATKADVTDLSPAGLDMAALNYRKTGVMPALGNGDKTTRKRIIDRAAALTPGDITRIEAGGTDVASNKATFAADQDSLKALQKQRDTISAFEQTAVKNIDIFLDQAKKVADTGSPLLNAPVRMVTGKMLGATDQAAYDAARLVAVNEIAKITSNPNLSGQLSDSARHEVESFNPRSATLKQSIAVMRLLKQDMQNRAGSMDEQIAAIKDRMKGKPPATGKTLKVGDFTVTVEP